MFCDNDISKAEKICDPNVKVHNLLVSDQTDGLDAWKKSLAGIFKGEPEKSLAAPCPGKCNMNVPHKFIV